MPPIKCHPLYDISLSYQLGQKKSRLDSQEISCRNMKYFYHHWWHSWIFYSKQQCNIEQHSFSQLMHKKRTLYKSIQNPFWLLKKRKTKQNKLRHKSYEIWVTNTLKNFENRAKRKVPSCGGCGRSEKKGGQRRRKRRRQMGNSGRENALWGGWEWKPH